MPSFNYATALRCIGQNLDRRGLKSFNIRLQGDIFIVECGYQDPPAPTPVSLVYTSHDIDELNQSGEKLRGHITTAQEFINQVQIFRSIGAYLDKNEGQLIRVSNNDGKAKDSSFTVEYLTRDGERVVDDRAGSAIYDMCVQMYKQRGKATGTGGRRAKGHRYF